MRLLLAKQLAKLGAKIRGIVSRSPLLNCLLSDYKWFRNYIGGTWAHYFTCGGIVEIWDYIPKGKTVEEVVEKVHFALYTETYEEKPIN